MDQSFHFLLSLAQAFDKSDIGIHRIVLQNSVFQFRKFLGNRFDGVFQETVLKRIGAHVGNLCPIQSLRFRPMFGDFHFQLGGKPFQFVCPAVCFRIDHFMVRAVDNRFDGLYELFVYFLKYVPPNDVRRFPL